MGYLRHDIFNGQEEIRFKIQHGIDQLKSLKDRNVLKWNWNFFHFPNFQQLGPFGAI